MKRYLVLFFLIVAIYGLNYGQSRLEKSKISIELSQFITNSGFDTGTGLNINLNPDNKRAFAIGPFFCPELKKICGITFQHEIMLWREKEIMNNVIKPFVFYNFIYRKTTIPEVFADNRIKGNLVTYTSTEHNIGMGLQINIAKSFYAKCNLGFGTYLGSIKRPSAPDPNTGEIVGTNGIGMMAGIRIGYYFF